MAGGPECSVPRLRPRWLTVGVVVFLAMARTGLAQTPIALVFNNSNYAGQPKLQGCEVSANLTASTLSRAGVKVTRLDNPSNARTGAAIAAFGDEVAATPKSRALIYFCGYVAAFSDRLFLVPVEARLEQPTDLLSQGILARQVLGAAVSADSEAGLVLMDVATLPGQPGLAPSDLASLVRPAAAAHGGLAVAALSPSAMGPAPLAAALADTLGTGQLELMSGLKAMQNLLAPTRTLTTVSMPNEPSWLVGSAPSAPTAPAAPAAVPGAPPPSAAAEPPSPTAPPAPRAASEPNPAERRRLQLALQRLGYFKGRVNGVFGPDTLNAIRQFQRDSNEEATGRLTATQSEQLLR